jgi:cell division protein FtsW
MGEGTFVNTSKPEETTAPQRSIRFGIDVPLLLTVASLIVFGLMMVYSSSWQFAEMNNLPPTYLLTRQITWVGVGLVAAFILSIFDYHRFRRLLVPMLAGTLILLFVVLVVSDIRLGAMRAILQGSVQPSELAKLVVVIYLSYWLFLKRDVLTQISFGLIPLIGILGLTGGLILAQPDLSAAITVFFLGGLLFFLAGCDLRQMILAMVLAVLLGWLVVNVSTTGRTRLDSYIQGFQDPNQASYHVQRSMEAVVKGGFFGVGIGRATTKFTGLPVAWTDSIFAIITEETGLLGAGLVVLAYGIILWRGLVIARRAPDMLGFLLASGLSIWIALEAIINMGVMVNLLPFAGNALPLISSGGSNLTVTMAAIGIITNISRASIAKKESKERSFSAVVDLRGRDRRRSVSRSRRPSSNGK